MQIAGMTESNNTGGLTQCPTCGLWVHLDLHECGGAPWHYVEPQPLPTNLNIMTATTSGPIVADAEVKDCLRRIAEALEAIVNLMTPSKPPPKRDADGDPHIILTDGGP